MKWRWPTWLFLAWLIGGPIVIGALAVNSAAARAGDYYEAGYQLGGAGDLWILGVIVLPIVWWTTRSRIRCPRCGGKVPKDALACPTCGYYPGLAPAVPTGQCPRCGQLVASNAPSCPRCGYVPGQPIMPPPPAAPPSAPPAPPSA